MYFRKASKFILAWTVALPIAVASVPVPGKNFDRDAPFESERTRRTPAPVAVSTCQRRGQPCDHKLKCCNQSQCRGGSGRRRCKRKIHKFKPFQDFAPNALEDEKYDTVFELGRNFLSLSSDGRTMITGGYYYREDDAPMYTFVQDMDITRPSTTVLFQDPRNKAFPYNETNYMQSAISKDGQVLAIGTAGANNNAGEVKTYLWDDVLRDWTPLETLTENFYCGEYVALSEDGLTMVVTATFNVDRPYFGYFQRYSLNGTTWEKEGPEVLTNTDGYFMNIKMTPNGDKVVVTESDEQEVHLYVWDPKADNWNKTKTFEPYLDSTFLTAFGDDNLEISDDGSTIVISDSEYDNDTGIAFVYTNDTEQVIIGLEEGSYFSYGFALSGDGETLALGAWSGEKEGIHIYKKRGDEGFVYQKQHIRVYENSRIALNYNGTVLAFEHNPEYEGLVSVYLLS